jgi:hypothetical protein
MYLNTISVHHSIITQLYIIIIIIQQIAYLRNAGQGSAFLSSKNAKFYGTRPLYNETTPIWCALSCGIGLLRMVSQSKLCMYIFLTISFV